MSQVIHGSLDASGRRVDVVVARFNSLVTERLLDGAVNALEQHGVASDAIRTVWVPGAFELPLASRWLAREPDCDAVVALGCVIRGSTSHYDYVCSEASRGILSVSLETDKPVAFGLLTCETLEQAMERAGGAVGNKGADAAMTALEMLGIRSKL
ncbi:MAG: 6,7-dimethyl-8-ribityllumazine synthase [Planctomycetes bacterium]|nr:6,7-dimethyl-8-ribityllumazine synthase [Planctomycetota bacterium]